jgi:hypothetical protein
LQRLGQVRTPCSPRGVGVWQWQHDGQTTFEAGAGESGVSLMTRGFRAYAELLT